MTDSIAHRCGRRTKAGGPCRTPTARPGDPCASHRADSDFSADVARRLLAQIDAGELDRILTAAARAALRTAAEAALAGIGDDDPTEGGQPAVARVIRVRPATRRGGRQVEISCPWCRSRSGKPRTHTHGWPLGDAEPGTRVAHCGARGEYRIVLGDLGGGL